MFQHYKIRQTLSQAFWATSLGTSCTPYFDATEFTCCTSSGKRASQFLKDKFTVHRFCFLPLSNVFFLSHSFAVFVMDVVSCMGNYISILYHNSVISTKKSIRKIGLPFEPLFKVWTAISTCSTSMNGPNSFQSMGKLKRGLHSIRINWLIAQRY